MFSKIKDYFKRKNKKRSEYQMFMDFMRNAKERMSDKMDKAMFDYLEEIYKKAVKAEKKIEKKKTPVSVWVSRDLEIDKEREIKKKEEENKLPHPPLN